VPFVRACQCDALEVSGIFASFSFGFVGFHRKRILGGAVSVDLQAPVVASSPGVSGFGRFQVSISFVFRLRGCLILEAKF